LNLANQFTVKVQNKISSAAEDICPGSTAMHWDRGGTARTNQFPVEVQMKKIEAASIYSSLRAVWGLVFVIFMSNVNFITSQAPRARRDRGAGRNIAYISRA
jgi:hypothetical protein